MGKFAFIATGYIIDYDGISVYIENLLKNLLLHSSLKNKELSLDIYIAESAKTVFIERIFSKNKYENIHILTIKDNNPILKMIHLQYMLLLNRNYTVVFMPNPMPLFLSAGKRIKVVHDLTIKKTPKFFSQKMHRYIDFLIWYMRRFDDAIGYISNQTKADIKQFYQIGEANKKMIHLPNGIPFKVLDTPRPKISNILEKYEQKSIEFVIVGRINRAKGFDRILKFLNYFENYLQNEHNFINVIVHVVGKQTIETREILNEAKLQKIHLQFHGFVDDKTLNNLYIKSHFCFFLSRNEGYGLPLVEAMWLRTIPIISDIPIFNEIMGKSFPKFNDENGYEEAIKMFILKVVNDKIYRKDIFDTLEEIVAYEQEGYKRSAVNLIRYIKHEVEK